MTKRSRGRPPYDDILTPSEWRVVHAVQHGMTDREIAARRGISRDAVKFHVANAIAKLGLKNRRALRQWFRVPQSSALRSEEPAMTASLNLGPIGQIARSVRDIKQSEIWYAHVLRLQHLYTFGTLAFFDCGGVRLFLSQTDGDATSESVLYFRVENIEQAHDDLKARGVEFTNAPHMIHRHSDGTEEWMAFFKDPEGRPLGIMAQVKKQP